MISSNVNVLAYVLAGGRGERLFPLTEKRAKPAVPFGASYRIIDFVMTNLHNSGVEGIALITQYQPRSLNRHVGRGYLPVFQSKLETLYPTGASYEGTADAIYKNLEILRRGGWDVVDIFGADHIYRMNISQMHDFHLDRGADATISVMPVDIDIARRNFGVVVVDDNNRIIDFQEKPDRPAPMKSNGSKCLSSMGNYCFNPKSLEDALKNNPKDFGKNVFNQMIANGRSVFAYDFTKNTIDGFKPEDVVYWRDVGNLDQFYQAHMDLLGENPVLRLQHQKWPMLTHVEVAEPNRVAGRAICLDYISANGVWVHDDATVKSSVISYQVEIARGAEVIDSILLGYNYIGGESIIRNSIIDRHVSVPPRTVIGVNKEDDNARKFRVSGKITVVPRDYQFKK